MNSTWRQLVYMCLDLIKAVSDDSYITIDHVIYLAKHYRIFLLKQEEERLKILNNTSSQSNYQTICLSLEQVDAIPNLPCQGGRYLRSVDAIPTALDDNTIRVYPYDYFGNINIEYTSRERIRFVGENKFMQNIVYCTKGFDDHLYFKSMNPQILYLQNAKLSGIFEDAEAAAKLSCGGDSPEEECIDFLDTEFPLESKLMPQLIELIVKSLIGFHYRQSDKHNNSTDDISDLINYIRSNVKNDLANQITS